MRLALTLAALILLSGIALAGPTTGEETLALDLTSIPGGSTYFLKCSRSRDIANCGLVSIWQQTNGIVGLQTTKFSFGGKPRQADSPLLA